MRANECVIAPFGQNWDSFFQGGANVDGDFLPERAKQQQSELGAL